MFPTEPISRILGLDVVEARLCAVGCGHVSISLRSHYRHVQKRHPTVALDGNRETIAELSNPISVHIVFGFRQNRTILKVLGDRLQQPISGGYAKYMAQVALRPQSSVDPQIYQLPSDKKLQSHFLEFTEFGSVIEGKDVGVIRRLIAHPHKQDRYYPLVAGCRSYFKYVASKLHQICDLFLRWIMTLKS